MSPFKEWWNGNDSPARRLPSTTADLVEHVAKAGWDAGRKYERGEHTYHPPKEAMDTEPFSF